MYLKKHLRKDSAKFLLLIAFLFFGACSEGEVPKGVVAKVGDEELTEAELQDALKNNPALYRQEYIRNWIETRALFAEAKNQNITNSEKFKRIVAEDKARIAGALLLQSYLKENEINVDEEEVQSYFLKYKEEFKLSEKAFVFNRADFTTKIDAQNFRYIAIEKDWKAAENFSKKSNGFVKADENTFAEESSIYPAVVRRILATMNRDELSVVFPTERKRFTVVQLVKIFNKNEVPDFDFLKEKIREILLIIKQKELIKKYKEDLYSKYNVEIYR